MDKVLVLVGHGADEAALLLYRKLLDAVRKGGKRAFLVMLHGESGAQQVAKELEKQGITSAKLIPLLLAPGHHMEKNIVSEDSEIHREFSARGIDLEVSKKTLLEYDSIIDAITKVLDE